ncbi:T9SS type A sorting domain-containing protein [Winogradskyella sediminis]|uniref:Por secretion system C-terminal sorting domain-containing protein n=2 Tax=Winogradskyella sediminis TaxID=1382466 RepID=A0A1H1LRB4_9FLAO|nr:T9SS type A sorting domain-containing protein [Winogradskyella sediminis]SDR76565.1 Por secretion system C-terminal sorting domain-containing protein [Winogradskyella sediminis]
MKIFNTSPTAIGILPILFILFSLTNISAQQLAFPTAKGAGAYASGGRGGQVIHVTTLDWDGPGSLKEAITTPGPRTIVFDVSGEIDATAMGDYETLISGSQFDDLTIAGQTAPNGGITIKTSFFIINEVDNVILRFLRFRNNSPHPNSDAIWLLGSDTVIYDHCTFSHGNDEGLDVSASATPTSSNNITIQNCFIQDSKTGSLMGDKSATGSFTFTNNAISGISHRFPNTTADTNGQIDVVNNVVYNWNNRLVRVTGNGNYNIINNYYKPSNEGLRRAGWFPGNTEIISRLHKLQVQLTDSPLIYTTGSVITGQRETPQEDDSDMWQYFAGSHAAFPEGNPVASQFFASTQFPLVGAEFTIKTANQAYVDVLSDVGANKTLNANGTVNEYLDLKDEADILMIQNDTFESYDSNNFTYFPRSEIPYPAIPQNSRPSDFYVSNPHIPEVWFQANVPEGQDHNDIAPSGYTWLEEYLNGVDRSNEITALESVVVTPSTAEIFIPETLQLTAGFIPDNTTNQNGTWSSSDETIAVVDANGLVTPISNGQVTITFTASDGGYTDTSEITVFYEALEPSAGEDQQICEGESITLTASGGTNYIWNTGETSNSINVTPESTTTYTVTVSDDNGQSEDATVTVMVNAMPTANAGEDQTICAGDSITLTATGGISYLWNTGETTASIEVSPNEETTYSVEVSNDTCSNLDDVTVFVNTAPILTITEDLVIVEGESALLTVSGSDTYEWSTGETTDSITVTPVSTTTYTVNAVGPNGCTSNAEVTVTVIPELIANAGNDQTICFGETVTLTAIGGSTYLWNTGDTGPELNVSPNETTTYTVTVEDEFGFTDTDDVTVFVNDLPNISINEDLFVMIGNSVTLTATGGNTYLWSTGESTSEITVSPDVTTTYTVTGFSETGCQSVAEVVVTVVEDLVANAGNDVTICLGESVILNASGGITYTWNTGDIGATQTFSPTETATYTVTVTDGFGNSDTDDVTITVNSLPIAFAGEDKIICQGESVELVAEGGDSYLWSTGETTSTINVTPNEDTIYTVEVFANDCSATDDVAVFVMVAPELTVSDAITIVSGSSTIIEASGADSYVWSTGETTSAVEVNPIETTTYSVTGFSINGCQISKEITVTVIAEVLADAGSDVSICNGESVTLTASGGTEFSWNTGDTSASITVSPTQTTTYTVTVTDSFGNSDSDSVIVNVNDLPILTISEGVTITEGESINLIVSGAETYQWSTGDTSSTIAVSPLETTIYTVTGYSATGCEVTEQVTVSVVADVIADAGSDVSICNGESVTLTASGGVDYEWNTGDASASIMVSPTQTTTYTVTVTDSFGNSDSDSVIVTVNDLPILTISEDVTITEGESINLIVSGAETYQWSTGDTSSTITVSPLETTIYAVTGYSATGCEVTEHVTVSVVADVIADAGSDVSICNGESVTLTASGGVDYEWNTGDASASITVSPTQTTTYTVTVTDSFGNSDTDSVIVTVNDLPIISVSENITIVEGESTSLSVSGAETYVWNTGETSNTIIVSPTVTTTYNVIGMTNSCTSELKEVTVTVSPLFRASAGSDTRVCDNQSYEVVLTANEGDSYLWSTGETTQSIVVNPMSTSTYSVTVTLGEQTDTDDVVVYVDPSPDVVIENGDSVDILNGDFVTLSVSGANSYQWTNGATQPNIAVSPSTTTTYEVRGFVGECYDDKQVTVNVLQPVVADAGQDVSICLNDLTTLTATGGDDYVWSTGETTPTITVSPTETTDYTVTVFNALDFDEATVRVEVDLNCAIDSTQPIEEEEEELNFDVYPNPASDMVNVKISGTVNVSDITIYDVTGKLVKQIKVANENSSYSTTSQIGISSFQSGVYFVRLISKDKAMTKKLIVE